MLLETLLVGEAGAIDTGQLVRVLVAVPVGTSHAHHLVVLQPTGVRHVRTSAQVFKVDDPSSPVT